MKNRKSRIIVAIRQSIVLTFTALLAVGSSSLAQNNTIFGPNVYVFSPSNSVSSINSTLSTLAGYTQFDTNRAAALFQPGTYTGVEAEVGYYESVAGLGESPTAVNINQGYLTVNTTDSNGNLTTNFWRSIENLSMVVPTADQSTLQWGVSQGSSFRRINVTGGVELANTDCGEASGGFISDSVISGVLNACSQQQWYTRNSSIGSFTGYVWNYVFSGVSGAPAQSNPFSNDAENVQDTVLATTPVVREKPYLRRCRQTRPVRTGATEALAPAPLCPSAASILLRLRARWQPSMPRLRRVKILYLPPAFIPTADRLT